MLKFMKQRPGFYQDVAALTVPMVLQNLITQSLGLIDTLMVGPLGEIPLAAVALANIPIFIIQYLVFGLQSGGTVLMSQYWGKKDIEAINRVMGIGMYTGGIISTLFAIFMFMFPLQFMGLFSNNGVIVAESARYARIVGFSYVFNSLTSVYIGAHRSMENPRLGLGILSVSMVLNPFLNWAFIYGHFELPALGIVGAAVATLISRCVEFFIMIIHILVNKRFRLKPALMLHPGLLMLRSYLRYATPVVINETLWGVGTSLYPTIMGHMMESSAILAAYSIAGGIEKVCLVAAYAVGNTTAVIIGREIGAGKTSSDGIYSMGRALDVLSLLGGLILGAVMAIISVRIINPILFPRFGLSARAGEIALMMQMMVFAILPLRSFNITNTVGVLRSGGDVMAASMIDILPVWLVALPLMILTGLVLHLDIIWVYLGLSMENTIKMFFSIWRLHTRKWICDITITVN